MFSVRVNWRGNANSNGWKVLDNTTLPFTIVNMADEPVQAIPTPGASPKPIDPKRIAETLTLARFRAAEDRIYPLIMVDPGLYQQAVQAVAGICERLRSRGLSREELLKLDIVETSEAMLTDPELFEQATALSSKAGLQPTALVEAAIAQLVSLPPVPTQDSEGANR